MWRLLPSPAGLVVAALGVFVIVTLRVKVDDLWWHLAVGEHILRTQHIPSTNLFSFTAPNEPWLAHEWLSEVLFALVYRLGEGWLEFFSVVLEMAGFGALAALSFRGRRHVLLSVLVTLASGLLLIANGSIRPYLFGNLALLATLGLVEGARLRHFRLALVALFAVWANLHGSFAFGLWVLGLRAVLGPAGEKRRNFGDLLMAMGAVLLTPHHVHGLLFPLRYLQTSLSGGETFLSNIMEWQRVELTSALGLVLCGVVGGAVATVLASRRAPTSYHVVLFLSFVVAGFLAVRNVPLIGMACAVALPPHFPRPTQALPRSSAWLPLSAWLVAASMVPPRALPTDFLPRHALAALKPSDRVFNSFNWGGALIFSGQRPFIDQRNDCYPPQVLRDYLTVHRLDEGWREVLVRWNIDSVLWPSEGRLAEVLAADPEWKERFRDEAAVVFERVR